MKTVNTMQIRYYFFAGAVLLIISAMTIVGCGGLSAKPSAEIKTGTEVDSDIPNDESLTPEEYIRIGLPAQDREWSGSDMLRAYQVLVSLTQKGYRSLPMYNSKRSGEVFSRLTSAQNLNLLKNIRLPLNMRFQQAFYYLEASRYILVLYLSAFQNKEVRDSELVELMGAMFRLTVVMSELVGEFLPTIRKDDPSYQVRMQGLEQIKQGYSGIVSGGLKTVTERENFRHGELIRLIGYMQETFPLLVPQLPPGVRKETMVRLEKMTEDAAMKDLQPDLVELHSKIKTALETGKSI